jgi:hypothetical protein
LGRARAGATGLKEFDDRGQELLMLQTGKAPGTLVAKLILVVAALNLIFLLSELTLNVVKVYFG